MCYLSAIVYGILKNCVEATEVVQLYVQFVEHERANAFEEMDDDRDWGLQIRIFGHFLELESFLFCYGACSVLYVRTKRRIKQNIWAETHWFPNPLLEALDKKLPLTRTWVKSVVASSRLPILHKIATKSGGESFASLSRDFGLQTSFPYKAVLITTHFLRWRVAVSRIAVLASAIALWEIVRGLKIVQCLPGAGGDQKRLWLFDYWICYDVWTTPV